MIPERVMSGWRVSSSFLKGIDEWRRKQEDLPSRAEDPAIGSAGPRQQQETTTMIRQPGAPDFTPHS